MKAERRGGCGRPRLVGGVALFGGVLASAAAAQIDGSSGTLDLLYYVRSGAVPGILGGVVGMLLRVGDRPSSKRSFIRAVLAGWLVGMVASGIGTWQGWPPGLVFAMMGLGGLISEPLARWATSRTSTYLDRAADRALPPPGHGGPRHE